ncbi:Uncharacterised protein r2_g1105 [Pycnogonum litorale]
MMEKIFSKRKVISNHEKYEERPSENEKDEEVVRGKDFFVAADAVVNSSSLFRFKDETEWDDSVDISVDCNSLLGCLECIPINQRYDLPPDVFTSEEMKQFEKQARENRQKYMLSLKNYSKKIVNPSNSPGDNRFDLLKCDESHKSDEVLRGSHQDDEIDYLLSLDTHNKLAIKKSATECVNKQQDHSANQISCDDNTLEDWLDSVLDS